MYRWLNNRDIPIFLKVIIKMILTLSCVYILGYLIYKTLDIARGLIHWLSKKEHFWLFMACILVTGITAFILAEFCLGLEPFEKFTQWVMDKVQDFRDMIARFIKGESK